MNKKNNKQKFLYPFEICIKEGHIGPWSTTTYTYAAWIGDHTHCEWIEEERPRWIRKCTRCGETEIHEKKPDDIIAYEKKRDKIMKETIAAIENHVFSL